LISSAKQSPVLLYLSESTASAEAQKVAELREKGVEVIPLPNHAGHFSFTDVLHDLHSRKVMHLLIEPGPTLARYMLQRGQADRIWIFRSPKTIEAIHGEAVSAASSVHYPSTASVHLDGDVLTEYLNDASDVFFKCEPSADFVLAAER
jgi:riboflavin biosynthesis pyrimidine reductase